jgi:hypothetical protein
MRGDDVKTSTVCRIGCAIKTENLLHRWHRICWDIRLEPAGLQERGNAALTKHGPVPSRSWAGLAERAFRHCRRAFVRSRHCSLCLYRRERLVVTLYSGDRLDLSYRLCVWTQRR